jgi:hypothetical protein
MRSIVVPCCDELDPFLRLTVVSNEIVETVEVQSMLRSFSSVWPMCSASSACVACLPLTRLPQQRLLLLLRRRRLLPLPHADQATA